MTNILDGTLVRIDAATNAPAAAIPVGASPTGVTATDRAVWVAASGEGVVVEVDPGTNHVEWRIELGARPVGMAAGGGSIWVTVQRTPAKLVTYPDAPAPAGAVLVPEVAESMPQISDGGRTYTFTVRSGFRFSPPSSRPVTAATFKRSIERVLAPATRSPVAGFLDDVVGARAFRTGRAAHVSGITAAATR